MSTPVLWQIHLAPAIIMTRSPIRQFEELPQFPGNLPDNEIVE